MPPMAGRFAHLGQVFVRHDGLTGWRVQQVMQVQAANLCIAADRAPPSRKAVRGSAFGVARKQERAGT